VFQNGRYTIAVGDHTSSYQPFDTIVNINFPHNYTRHKGITVHPVRYKYRSYTVYSIGMHDDENEPFLELVDALHLEMDRDVSLSQKPHVRILFHCYAGKSRSVAFCLAFLLHRKVIDTVDTGLQLIKEARPFICPKQEYITSLGGVQRGVPAPHAGTEERGVPAPHAGLNKKENIEEKERE